MAIVNYYMNETVYPKDLVLSMLTCNGKKGLIERDIGFLIGQETYTPHERFNSGKALWQKLRDLGAHAYEKTFSIHVGRFLYPTWTEECELREVVLDFDFKDLPEGSRPCECGKGKTICHICWYVCEALVVLVNEQLVPTLPELGTPMFVFSGKKGVHVWFRGPLVWEMKKRDHDALLAYTLTSPTQSTIDALVRLFEERAVNARNYFDYESVRAKALSYLPRFSKMMVVSKWNKSGESSSHQRWKTWCEVAGAGSIAELVLFYSWSVLDQSVTGSIAKIVRLPFSTHYSRRIVLPFDPKFHIDSPPVLTVDDVMDGKEGSTMLLNHGKDVMKQWLEK